MLARLNFPAWAAFIVWLLIVIIVIILVALVVRALGGFSWSLKIGYFHLGIGVSGKLQGSARKGRGGPMRFQVNIPANLVPAAAGSQIHVYEAGTANHVAQTLYSDPASGATLSNPYSHPGGKVNFYTSQPVRVQIGVQPAGAASPVISPPVTSSSKQFSYSVMKIGGRPSGWVLS